MERRFDGVGGARRLRLSVSSSKKLCHHLSIQIIIPYELRLCHAEVPPFAAARQCRSRSGLEIDLRTVQLYGPVDFSLQLASSGQTQDRHCAVISVLP